MSVSVPNPLLLSPKTLVDIHGQPIIEIGDSANLGPFGWLRTASPQYVFDAQFTYDDQPLLFESVTNGSGATVAHNSTERCVRMTFSATPTGGKAYKVQYEHNRYQPGRGQTALVTFNFNGGVANCLKFAGYSFGATNGIELQMNGTTARLALYSDTSLGDQFVDQADWDDPMDGTGPSGITVDWTKVQILCIDLQALYVGRARVWLDIDGCFVKIHEFNHANRVAYGYIQTANLPIRCGMTCTGTVTTTMDFYCSSVISEGGQPDEAGYHFGLDTAVTAGSGTRTHALSIRHATTFNSIGNRQKIVPESVEILAGINPVKVELCYGQLLNPASFSIYNSTYANLNYCAATNGTISGSPAIVADVGYVASSASNRQSAVFNVPAKYPLTLNEAGTARSNFLGTFTVVLTGIGGASDCQVAINWKQFR